MVEKRSRRPRSILRLKVNGPHIRPGRIPIPQLLVLCGEAQTAINRQAEALRGGQSLRPGPTTQNVLEECTLDLFSIGKGSATMSFAAPEIDDIQKPQLVEMQRLSEAAVQAVIRSIRNIKDDPTAPIETGVLSSLREMGALVSNGLSTIEWIAPRAPGRKRAVAVFDHETQERIGASKESPSVRRIPVEIDGRLEMADFKETDLKCSIHMPDGRRRICSFTPELADSVYTALRRVARIKGFATINPITHRPEDIDLTSVTPLDPFLEDGNTFFSGLSLEQLAKSQGVTTGPGIQPVAGLWREDDDLDEFLADVYQRRS